MTERKPDYNMRYMTSHPLMQVVMIINYVIVAGLCLLEMEDGGLVHNVDIVRVGIVVTDAESSDAFADKIAETVVGAC